MKKILNRILQGLLVIILIANIYLVVSGRTYIYKGLVNTYLIGQSGPGISEHDIFYNDTVRIDSAQPWPEFAQMRPLSKQAEDSLRNYCTVSFTVVQHDSVLFEHYWEDYEPGSITNSFSMAKSITATLTAIAIEEGFIDSLDQAVGDYLPSFTEGGKEDITIRDLMTMSSGLNWTESGANPFSDNAEAYYGWDLQGQVDRLERIGDPGKTFIYLSGNHQIMAFVLEAATDMSISDYASSRLWGPIGAESDALWNLDDEGGMAKAYCCFYATARDFARIGQLMLDSGRWNGKQVVPLWYATEAVQPNGLVEEDGTPCVRYGLSWWIAEYQGLDLFYARGIKGQYIIVIPELDAVITRAGHMRGPVGEDGHPGDLFVYLDVALEILNP